MDIQKILSQIKIAFSDEHYEECAILCEKILSVDPDNFDTLCHYSRCLYHQEDYFSSLNLLSKCIDMEDGHSHLWHFRGDCYYKIGDYQNAIHDYRRSFYLDPTNVANIDDIAQCLYFLGDFESAYSKIDQAILLDTANVMPMIRKAQFFEHQGRVVEAVAQYKNALYKFPDDEFCRNKVNELIDNSDQKGSDSK